MIPNPFDLVPQPYQTAAAFGLGAMLVVSVAMRVAGASRVRWHASRVATGALPRRGRYGPSPAAVAMGVAASLRIQSRRTAGKLFVWDGRAHLLRASDDDWSIGYLHGYTLQALYRSGVNPREAERAVEAVFCNVFGREWAQPLLIRLSNLEAAQGDYDVGYEAGMADATLWMASKGKDQPRGWADHISGFERGG